MREFQRLKWGEGGEAGSHSILKVKALDQRDWTEDRHSQRKTSPHLGAFGLTGEDMSFANTPHWEKMCEGGSKGQEIVRHWRLLEPGRQIALERGQVMWFP